MTITAHTSQASATPGRCARTDEVAVCLRDHGHPGLCVSPEMSASVGVRAGEYEESRDYTFEITSDGVVKDRFWFYGPYSAGMELAELRAARFDNPFIHVEI
jgi:hypothetical protein